MSNVQILIDALEKLARLGNEPHYGNSHGNVIAQDVLEKYYGLEKQKCVVDGGYCDPCVQFEHKPETSQPVRCRCGLSTNCNGDDDGCIDPAMGRIIKPEASQPVDCFIASDGVSTYCNNYGELVGFSEDAKIAMYSSPPDYEALKAENNLLKEVEKGFADLSENLQMDCATLKTMNTALRSGQLKISEERNALKLRVAELEDSNINRHYMSRIEKLRDSYGKAAKLIADQHLVVIDLTSERDRLQSECDIVKRDLSDLIVACETTGVNGYVRELICKLQRKRND